MFGGRWFEAFEENELAFVFGAAGRETSRFFEARQPTERPGDATGGRLHFATAAFPGSSIGRASGC